MARGITSLVHVQQSRIKRRSLAPSLRPRLMDSLCATSAASYLFPLRGSPTQTARPFGRAVSRVRSYRYPRACCTTIGSGEPYATTHVNGRERASRRGSGGDAGPGSGDCSGGDRGRPAVGLARAASGRSGASRPRTPSAPAWKQGWVLADDGTWYWGLSDGTFAKDEWVYTGGSWYLMDADGAMMTGMVQKDGDLVLPDLLWRHGNRLGAGLRRFLVSRLPERCPSLQLAEVKWLLVLA